MNYYVVKTGNKNIVQQFKNGNLFLEVDGLNGYDKENRDKITAGVPLFLVFGGDNVPWTLGLAAICKTTSGPLNKGYDPSKINNYKLDFNVEVKLPEILKRTDFIPYRDSYDSFIGPSTKGSRNQALFKITEKQVVGILRGILDKYPDLEPEIANVFSSDIIEKVKQPMTVYLPVTKNYGERIFEESNNITINEPGKNIILYGVPGCGKSYTIDSEYCSDDNYMERVVFHPDYTYSDFIGQIVPKINKENGNVEYNFSAGPFTRVLHKAVLNPDHMYYLVVEEINRGNAPAIFGDVFQLLDRNQNGESIYGITNYEVADMIYKNPDKMIKIPANLTILATMNTADQSVFVLDTAFKRRWEMKLVANDINSCKYADTKILDTNVTWGVFATAVNRIIIKETSDLTGSEDKRLGAYFVREDDLKLIDEDYNPAFAEKVLMYLWNDVFKYNKDLIFDERYDSLENLIEGFKMHKFKIFKIQFDQSAGEVSDGI